MKIKITKLAKKEQFYRLLILEKLQFPLFRITVPQATDASQYKRLGSMKMMSTL